MAGRKAAPKAETPAPPQGVSAEGPTTEEPTVEVPAVEPASRHAAPEPKPAPPHPVKRYQVAPAAHLGRRVGGFELTERGWVPATPEQE